MPKEDAIAHNSRGEPEGSSILCLVCATVECGG